MTVREHSNHQTAIQSFRIFATIAALVTVVLTGLPAFYRSVVLQPAIKLATASNKVHVESAGPLPEIAWLMTYPNSGTTYTLKLIQQYTNSTTATNYGNEQGVHGTSIPVHPHLEAGPFFRYPTWNRPPRYILTKTHCGGTRMSGKPSDYIETTRSFEIACRSGNRMLNDSQTSVTYDMTVPTRAVHLIRNPFDNIVARLHLEEKKWARTEECANKTKAFNATKEGFLSWCEEMDRRSLNSEQKSNLIDPELLELAKQVPCHSEFIRYTWWHNHAIELIRRKSLPAHTFFYEDYENKWQETVGSLFSFLELSPADGTEPLEFIKGKHYGEYFNTQQIEAAESILRLLASPATWNFVQHYF